MKKLKDIITTYKLKRIKKNKNKYIMCEDCYDFAKDLTLEQFLNTCKRGDWILSLFQQTNPDDLQALNLAKGHCANTVRHLMKDEISIKAVDAAIAFGEGKISKDELINSAADSVYVYAGIAHVAAAAEVVAMSTYNDTSYVRFAAYVAKHAAAVASDAAGAAAACNFDYPPEFAASDAADAYAAAAVANYDASTFPTDIGEYQKKVDEIFFSAQEENQKLTADICRKYLPLEIWNF